MKVLFLRSGKWDVGLGGPYVEGVEGKVKDLPEKHAQKLIGWGAATDDLDAHGDTNGADDGSEGGPDSEASEDETDGDSSDPSADPSEGGSEDEASEETVDGSGDDSSDQPDINGMDKNQLQAYAKKEFGVDLDKRKSEKKLREEVFRLIESK